MYADICRAAFFIPPGGWKFGDGDGMDVAGRERVTKGHDRVAQVGDCPLRSVARIVGDRLAVRWFFSNFFQFLTGDVRLSSSVIHRIKHKR